MSIYWDHLSIVWDSLRIICNYLSIVWDSLRIVWNFKHNTQIMWWSIIINIPPVISAPCEPHKTSSEMLLMTKSLHSHKVWQVFSWLFATFLCSTVMTIFDYVFFCSVFFQYHCNICTLRFDLCNFLKVYVEVKDNSLKLTLWIRVAITAGTWNFQC